MKLSNKGRLQAETEAQDSFQMKLPEQRHKQKPTVCCQGHPGGDITLVAVAGAAVRVLAADEELHHMVPDGAVCIQCACKRYHLY